MATEKGINSFIHVIKDHNFLYDYNSIETTEDAPAIFVSGRHYTAPHLCLSLLYHHI